MFCRSHIQQYFLQADASKSNTFEASKSSGYETFANLVSLGAETYVDRETILLRSTSTYTIVVGSIDGDAIVTASTSRLKESCSNIREYPILDLRYAHTPRLVVKRACETRNLMYNQLQKHAYYANPTMNLITSQHLDVLQKPTMIDFPQLLRAWGGHFLMKFKTTRVQTLLPLCYMLKIIQNFITFFVEL